jgi:hypothetical protein
MQAKASTAAAASSAAAPPAAGGGGGGAAKSSRSAPPVNEVDAASSDESIDDLRQYGLATAYHIYTHIDCPNRHISPFHRFCNANGVRVLVDDRGRYRDGEAKHVLESLGINYLGIDLGADGCVSPSTLTAEVRGAANDKMASFAQSHSISVTDAPSPRLYPNGGSSRLDWSTASFVRLKYMKTDCIENFFACMRGGTLLKFAYGKISSKAVRSRFGQAQTAYLYGSSAGVVELESTQMPAGMPYAARINGSVVTRLLYARAPACKALAANAFARARLFRKTLVAVTAYPSHDANDGVGTGLLRSPGAH